MTEKLREIEERDSSQNTFEALLRWLHPDRDVAGTIYQEIRVRLMKFFECQRCACYEQYADETMDRVLHKIGQGTIINVNNPYTYFHGVARNVLKEFRKTEERKLKLLNGAAILLQPAESPIEVAQRKKEQIEREQYLECLEHCLAALPPETRELFIDYHSGEQRARIENRNRLAARLDIPINALRIRIHKIREGLSKCISNCVERARESKESIAGENNE
ncbi:MAG: hypothetical protein AB1489_23365 [Acidobacteriota bacterium]